MKNKRILVLGIALIFMAMVAVVIFAGEMKGVQWAYNGDGSTFIQNDNDYGVTITLESDNPPGLMTSPWQSFLAAGSTRTMQGIWTVTNVRKGRP